LFISGWGARITPAPGRPFPVPAVTPESAPATGACPIDERNSSGDTLLPSRPAPAHPSARPPGQAGAPPPPDPHIRLPGWFSAVAIGVAVLTNHRDATADNLYRLFARSFLRPSLAEVDLAIVPVVVLLAALLLCRLPDRLPDLPAVMPAFALSLAWMLAWP
jgi:hypothetical protein